MRSLSERGVFNTGIGQRADVQARRGRQGLRVANHDRMTGALRGDKAEEALRPMAGWDRVVTRWRIEAAGSHGTADLELGLPERRGGRHAEPDACNQGLEREQTGYAGR